MSPFTTDSTEVLSICSSPPLNSDDTIINESLAYVPATPESYVEDKETLAGGVEEWKATTTTTTTTPVSETWVQHNTASWVNNRNEPDSLGEFPELNDFSQADGFLQNTEDSALPKNLPLDETTTTTLAPILNAGTSLISLIQNILMQQLETGEKLDLTKCPEYLNVVRQYVDSLKYLTPLERNALLKNTNNCGPRVPGGSSIPKSLTSDLNATLDFPTDSRDTLELGVPENVQIENLLDTSEYFQIESLNPPIESSNKLAADRSHTPDTLSAPNSDFWLAHINEAIDIDLCTFDIPGADPTDALVPNSTIVPMRSPTSPAYDNRDDYIVPKSLCYTESSMNNNSIRVDQMSIDPRKLTGANGDAGFINIDYIMEMQLTPTTTTTTSYTKPKPTATRGPKKPKGHGGRLMRDLKIKKTSLLPKALASSSQECVMSPPLERIFPSRGPSPSNGNQNELTFVYTSEIQMTRPFNNPRGRRKAKA